LTVAEHLVADGHEVAFAGTPEGPEAHLAPAAGVTFYAVRSRGFDRSRPLTLVTSAAGVLASAVQAFGLLRRFRPDVVLGFGGYVSLPVGLAAVLRRAPLVLHEQNSVPGLANRVLSRWAVSAGVTYEGSVTHLARPERASVTGNPVREAVLTADRGRGRAALGLDEHSTVLLVFGGSRGARHINDAMVAAAPRLASLPALQVVHVAGRIEAAAVADAVSEALGEDAGAYRVVDYLDAMGDAIAAADLVVARAGATSIAEITAIGRPSVLVPYPYATDDHQSLNAAAVADAGAAVVLADAELDGQRFLSTVLELLADTGRREQMAAAARTIARRDAAQRVVALVEQAARVKREIA
jgi:UDP-N-acetylglucosamine--N-acetylmuramyl-(pentapeptide) pyrophosphoryl-undecaprenol N-acetylglucosamine transferase